MKYHLIYVFYIFFFIASSIGAGLVFSNYINNQFKNLNLGYQGIIGIFFITFISVITSLFLKHGYVHNSILHLLSLFFFFKIIFTNQTKIQELKDLFFLILIFFIGIYIYKNHDDFPYYHLAYSLSLTENSMIIGQGIFSHGFRTYSSIFYFHSTLFMPMINFYSFHLGPFLILIFFNFILIKKIFSVDYLNKINLNFYFCLLSLAFTNIIFYRIGEHGTDRSAQVIAFLIFVHLIEILFEKKNNDSKKTNINLLLLFIIFAVSLKSTYAIYLILILFLIIQNRNFISSFIKSLNFKFASILVIAFSMNFLINFLNTGCMLYPEEKTCLGSFEWSIPKNEVKQMKTHYEWWAKAGGGPSYKSNLTKDEYIKNFNWLSSWIKRHFYPKITDTLLGTLTISSVLFFLLHIFKKKKVFLKNVKIKFLNKLYIMLFIIFLVWFLKHPSMRYGGYVLIGLPIFLYLSSLFCRLDFTIKNKKKIALIFIVLICVSYNIRNIKRLHKEINFYNYQILQSPFYFVENVQSDLILDEKNFQIYSPKNGKMCWASKTPCSYNRDIKLKKFKNFNIIVRNEK